ncbi:MAG: hypothetical protein AAGF23_23370 [Acidobacteriota bacterium]
MADVPPIPKPDPPPPQTDLRRRSFEEEYGRPSERDGGEGGGLAEEIEIYGPDLVIGAGRRAYGCLSGLVLGFLIACVGAAAMVLGDMDGSPVKVFVLCVLGGGALGLVSPGSTSISRIAREFWS